MRTRFRSVPGVPIVHLNRTVMVLEPPSDATMQAKRRVSEPASFGSTLNRYFRLKKSLCFPLLRNEIKSPPMDPSNHLKNERNRGLRPLTHLVSRRRRYESMRRSRPQPREKSERKGSGRTNTHHIVGTAQKKRLKTSPSGNATKRLKCRTQALQIRLAIASPHFFSLNPNFYT